MSSRVLERMLDEIIATIAAEGITTTREQLRVKVTAALWSRPAVLATTGAASTS